MHAGVSICQTFFLPILQQWIFAKVFHYMVYDMFAVYTHTYLPKNLLELVFFLIGDSSAQVAQSSK